MSTVDPKEWVLPTRQLGRRVLAYPRLDSTNSHALSLGHNLAHHGLVILAQEQTAGRGQYGRTWQAPPGSSVLMSVLLFPPERLCRPVLLTAWAAVAVAELVSQITNLSPKIKWPNDVYLEGKKVCGILIEQRSSGRADQPPATAVGIGLNVSQPAEFFERAGLTLGASLHSIAGVPVDHQEVARGLIQRLDDDYARMMDGDFAALEYAWRSRLGLLDRLVRVELINGVRNGRLADVALDAVELDTGDEAPLRLQPEMIRHLEALI